MNKNNGAEGIDEFSLNEGLIAVGISSKWIERLHF